MVERKKTGLAKARKAVCLLSISRSSTLIKIYSILGSNVDTTTHMFTSDCGRLFYLDSWILVLTNGQVDCKRERKASRSNYETVSSEDDNMTLV